MTDVNSNAGQDDFYDDATDTFPKVEHLAPSIPPNFGAGRLCAIWVTGEGKRKNDRGEFYPYVETVTVVLDEGPNGQDWLTGQNGWSEDASTLVPASPFRLDKFQHSTGGLVSRLSRRLTGRNADGVPLRFRPMIGRINTQSSKANKHVPAYSIAKPTDADREVVNGHGDLLRSINRELEAAETTGGSDPDTAAFDS
jgi:hypothetical protein